MNTALSEKSTRACASQEPEASVRSRPTSGRAADYLGAMAKTESKGMRSGLHYVVEFLVILLGITVSVTIEKNNAREYKREVKDQGLTRILANLHEDSVDLEFNIKVHAAAYESCRWMVEHRETISTEHPDSVGKHCSLCNAGQTLFVDNQEEYRTLQNSGLIELIENDELARALQSKYVQHQFMHRVEGLISVFARSQHPTYYRCMESYEGMEFFMNYIPYRRWNGEDFGAGFIEQLEDLSGGHRTYLREMRDRLERDAELAGWIREEIGAE